MARTNPPEAIIENGKVVNAEQLRRYWRRYNHHDYIRRRAIFENLRELAPLESNLEDRVNNLEALSAQSGSVPKLYEERIGELQAQLRYLQNKMLERNNKRKENVLKSASKEGIEL